MPVSFPLGVTNFPTAPPRKHLMRLISALITTTLLFGCAGKVDYVRPISQQIPGANSKTVEKPREAIWNAAVPELGKSFFVINNLDKSSGLINISYSGDPEAYIDCGRVTSYVKNARGERTYDFAGAKAQQNYEVMDVGNGLFQIDRRMSLEGRVNLVFEEITPTTTRITANTRYVVQRQRIVRNMAGSYIANSVPHTLNDNISFTATGTGAFSPGPDGKSTECISTGALEREILTSIK